MFVQRMVGTGKSHSSPTAHRAFIAARTKSMAPKLLAKDLCFSTGSLEPFENFTLTQSLQL